MDALDAGDGGRTSKTWGGRKIFFVDIHGNFATHAVGSWGNDEDGNVAFFEITGKLDSAVLDGKKMFKRLLVKRVFPVMEDGQEEE